MGDCQIVGASLPWVAVNPAPVSVEPAGASAVIACVPAPDRPVTAGATAIQVPLVAPPPATGLRAQMTTSWLPGAPAVPVAMNPAPAVASAVTARFAEAAPAGAGSVSSSQVAPPSADIAANGRR